MNNSLSIELNYSVLLKIKAYLLEKQHNKKL